jgi:MoaA/NifB/PqqE/SkfB family radical SAM enzyme
VGRYQRSLGWAAKQFINHIRQDIAYRNDTGNCVPARLIFCLTIRCNIKCRQCGIWKIKEKKKELTIEEWKQVFLNLKNWLGSCRVQIAGGEVFLKKDVIELVKYAHELGILMGMVSNGTMIDEKRAKDLVDVGLNYIDISIDSIHAKTHDYIRGVDGVYEKAMKAIQYLKKYSDKNNHSLSVVLATVVMGTNMNDLVDLVHFVKDHDLDGIIFNPLGPPCDSTSDWYEHSELWPQKGDLPKLDKVIDQLATMKKEGYRILNSVDQLLGMKEYFRKPVISGIRNCMVGVTNYLMSCDGEVSLCFRMPPIGNYKQLPQDIWNSETAKRTRKMIKNCTHECSPGNFLYRRSLIKEIQRYLTYR